MDHFAASHCPTGDACVTMCEKVCFDDDLLALVNSCDACDCTTPCGLNSGKSAVALSILVVTLLLLAKKRWVFLPVGRTMGAFCCAVLMVWLGGLHTVAAVLDTSGTLDLNSLATLFGLTVLVGYMDDFGFIDAGMNLLQTGSVGPRLLLLKVCLLTSFLAALVTNDAAVIALTHPLIAQCRKLGVKPEPFLIALSSSANLGSSLTLIGNPQNIIIANLSGLPFFSFLLQMSMVVSICTVVNYGFLVMFFSKDLCAQQVLPETEGDVKKLALQDDASSRAFSEFHSGDTFLINERITRSSLQTCSACIAMALIVVGFIFLNAVSWVALAAVVALLLIEVYLRDGEGTRVLEHVDGPLLVMIGSLCLVIAGARLTGVPEILYDKIGASIGGVDMDYDSWNDTLLATLVITVLSQIVSNVPTVLLLGPLLQAQGGQLGWLLLAFVSTVAGNLTLVGSIANLIVAERSAQKGEELTFWRHFRFSSWSTIIVILVGVAIIWFIVRPIWDLH